MDVHNIAQETMTKIISKKKKMKTKQLSEEVLQIAEGKHEVKGRGEREVYTELRE